MTTKKCSKCKVVKSYKQFRLRPDRKCGYTSWCKECLIKSCKVWRSITDNKVKRRIYKDWWVKNNKDKVINQQLKEFGLTFSDYTAILTKQQGVCRICKGISKNKRLAVDHCHRKNKVRGLLCMNCNTGLGMFKENIEALKEAINYLQEFDDGEML